MADGFRTPKKLSGKQLTDQVSLLNARLDILTNAVAADMQRLNVLLFSYFKEIGKAEELECPHCGVSNIRPLIEGIEIDPRCVSCGKLIEIEELPDEAFNNPEKYLEQNEVLGVAKDEGDESEEE